VTRADVQVNDVPDTRTIILHITKDEAELLREWLHQTHTEPPYSGKLLYGAVSAVADGRNHGGH
jgi:hypothetical protein